MNQAAPALARVQVNAPADHAVKAVLHIQGTKIAVARIVIRQPRRDGLGEGMGSLPHVLAQIPRESAVIQLIPAPEGKIGEQLFDSLPAGVKGVLVAQQPVAESHVFRADFLLPVSDQVEVQLSADIEHAAAVQHGGSHHVLIGIPGIIADVGRSADGIVIGTRGPGVITVSVIGAGRNRGQGGSRQEQGCCFHSKLILIISRPPTQGRIPARRGEMDKAPPGEMP